MISQKKVRLMALSAIYREHGGGEKLFAAGMSKAGYCAAQAVCTGLETAAALVFIKILQCMVNGQWADAAEAIRTSGFGAFFGMFHPVFDICFIVLYMLFAFRWYGKSYEKVSDEAKKEKNRRELISRLDQPRRSG